MIEPDSIPNEIELKLDHRMKITVSDTITEYRMDEPLDEESYRYNNLHKKLNLNKLDQTLNKSNNEFLNLNLDLKQKQAVVQGKSQFIV